MLEEQGLALRNKGLSLFEQRRYAEAVESLIEAWELGYEKQEILEFLYANFILPNEQEFRRNYEENNQGFSTLEFDELPIDFVYVEEDVFYLFDREGMEFLGRIVLKEPKEDEREVEFDSILIAEAWDIRQMLPYMEEKNWSTIYLVLDEWGKYFMSFCKLPGFTRRYLEKAVVFSSEELMWLYFRSYAWSYLPRTILAGNQDKYAQMITRIHEERLQAAGGEREQVFLSICIPSYNRGTFALRNIENLRKLPYDAEVEFILSNNGSVKDTEGYEEIKKLALCDSRIKYFAFEKNREVAANVRKVLELSSGRFAVIVSDEDLMLLEKVGAYLNFLLNHPDAGLVITDGYGSNFLGSEREVCRFPIGYDSINSAMNRNYITGMTINMEIFHGCKCLSRFGLLEGNVFVENYPHIAFGVMIAEQADVWDSGLCLWDAREVEETPSQEETLLAYMTLESRVAQQQGAIELLDSLMLLEREIVFRLSLERMQKTAYLLWLAYKLRTKAFAKESNWVEVCLGLYENNLKLCREGFSYLNEDGRKYLESAIEEILLDGISKNPAEELQSLKEKAVHQIVAALISYRMQTGSGFESGEYTDAKEKAESFLDIARKI